MKFSPATSSKSGLITFWVAVPPKTEPADFFAFLQQQGYLRVWLDGEVVRADTERKNLRLGARVQVIQDRLTIDEEIPRAAHRSARDRASFRQRPDQLHRSRDQGARIRIRTGWHCAHCDLDIAPPTPGLFSFNNPLGACPECRGFGRTIAVDLRPRDSRSLALASPEARSRVSAAKRWANARRIWCEPARAREIDIHLPFEELPKCDQDFVINGEKGAGEYSEDDYENDRWYGVRGFFKWLESKTYKMHVRVLLSRYRAYTNCPGCDGGRYQPETLNYRLVRQDGIAFTLAGICRASRSATRAIFSPASRFRLTTPPRKCCARKSSRGSVTCARSASVISPSIAPRARSAAAKWSA